MLAISLFFTDPAPLLVLFAGAPPLVHATIGRAYSAAEPSSARDAAVPWTVLVGHGVVVKTHGGLIAQGKLLGTEDSLVYLADADGKIITLAASDVASVRLADAEVKAAVPAPVVTTDDLPPHGEDDEDRVAHRARTEIRIQAARRGAIAGGVLGSMSAVASAVAEGFNIARWSLSEYNADCDEGFVVTEYDSYDCGWGYVGTYGIVSATTVAFPLHIAAGPSLLGPTRRLRDHLRYREGRGRQVAAWALWSVGMGSLVADPAAAWTTLVDSSSSRGVPPPFYLISAGLTLSSTILGMIDTKRVIAHAERSGSSAGGRVGRTGRGGGEPKRTLAVFPMRVQRGGGVGVAGRF